MVNNKRTMIFFDVDGTLINGHSHGLPASTLEALNRLKSNGFKVGIATGRGRDSIEKLGILKEFEFDGLVLNNGQQVYDHTGQLIFEKFLPVEAVYQCIEISKRLNIPLVIKSNPRIITIAPNEDVWRAREYLNNSIPEVGVYQGQTAGAMVAYGPLGYDYHDFEGIDHLKVLPGMSSYCDLTLSDASKLTGINLLLELWGRQDYIGFGDSLNDIEMLKGATIAVCMGDGHEEAKKIADHVTTSLEDDGIYNACTHLKLI